MKEEIEELMEILGEGCGDGNVWCFGGGCGTAGYADGDGACDDYEFSNGWDCRFGFAYGHHNGGGLGSGLGWEEEGYGEYPSNDFGFALLVCSDPLWLVCMGEIQ